MKPADWAWATIGIGVLAYEAVAARKEWDLLSEAVDKYRAAHPWVTVLAVTYLATHLLRVWPARLDPLHRLATGLRR